MTDAADSPSSVTPAQIRAFVEQRKWLAEGIATHGHGYGYDADRMRECYSASYAEFLDALALLTAAAEQMETLRRDAADAADWKALAERRRARMEAAEAQVRVLREALRAVHQQTCEVCSPDDPDAGHKLIGILGAIHAIAESALATPGVGARGLTEEERRQTEEARAYALEEVGCQPPFRRIEALLAIAMIRPKIDMIAMSNDPPVSGAAPTPCAGVQVCKTPAWIHESARHAPGCYEHCPNCTRVTEAEAAAGLTAKNWELAYDKAMRERDHYAAKAKTYRAALAQVCSDWPLRHLLDDADAAVASAASAGTATP